MSEAVLQGARDIIGLRRVQLERELHELSTRQASTTAAPPRTWIPRR